MNKETKRKLLSYIALILLCVIINMAGALLVDKTDVPLYLDAIGTIIASALLGYLPGITVGFTTNVLNSVISQQSLIYYGVINVLIALVSAWAFKKIKQGKKIYAIVLILVASCIGGIGGGILTWYIYGPEHNEPYYSMVSAIIPLKTEWGLYIASTLIKDICDKTISVVVAVIAMMLCNVKNENDENEYRKGINSLSFKVGMFISIPSVVIAIVAVSISTKIFIDTTISDHEKIATGATQMMSDMLDKNNISRYTFGNMKGYEQDKSRLETIMKNYPDLTYMYVYQIQEDGCHVIFDMDTGEVPGEKFGTIIPFDESFKKYLPLLLKGEKIDPIITNDTYGWLLTVYTPVYDMDGACLCYAAVDIAMSRIIETAIAHAIKMMALFAGFFIFILSGILWIIRRSVISPINKISTAAQEFIYEKESEQNLNSHAFDSIDIHTKDEIEDLYKSCVTLASDCVGYIDRIKEQSEKLQQMQDGLIMVLADVVESRDQYTGNHIKNTSMYVKLIVNEMKKEHIYEDTLTDEYMANVIHSAPLHDVGKIRIPDAILNKPSRLTDEEFDIMKHHTDEGNNIIETAVEIVPDPMYLTETLNMAEYHHEKWDGSGYPNGLKGEGIPLSARIMAVADVYDALVSKRSYKDGFPPDKAFKIIEEGAGTHFDPLIVKAFLNCRPEIEIET